MEKERKIFLKGVSYVLLSAAGVSLTGLFGKLGYKIFTLSSLLFWRFFFAFLVGLVVFGVLGTFKHPVKIGNLKMHLLRAGFVLGAQYSFYYYIQEGTLLNGTMLLSTGPLFIPIIEWLILKKSVRRESWVALAISFMGVICVLQPDRNIFSLLSAIGLLSGVCQGASQVVFAINVKEERSDYGVLYLFFLCAFISFWPYILNESVAVGETGTLWYSLFLIAGMGISSVFNQLARSVAYQHGAASRLAVFLYFAVVLAGFWDWLIFHDLPNWVSVIGVTLIIFSGIFKIYFGHLLSKKT